MKLDPLKDLYTKNNLVGDKWSAGFTKLQFDIILNQDLKIKVLNSALAGDSICRFSISLADVNYKK